MPFPNNAVLTNFTGADETPLSEGGNWISGIQPVGANNKGLKRVSNQAMYDSTAGTSQSYWHTLFSGGDMEAYVDVPVKPGTGAYCCVWLRVQNPGNGSTAAGYQVVFFANNNVQVWKMTSGGTFTQVTTGTLNTTQSWASGDSFGGTIVGNTITIYYKASGGSWTQIAQGTDSTITGGGYIGLESGNPGATFDNYGGGAISTNAKISTFSEDFSGSLTTKWTSGDANGGVSSIVSAQLQQATGASTTTIPQARIVENTAYDLSESSIFAQLIAVPGLSNVITAFRVMLDDNNWVGVRYDAGNIVAYKSEASSPSDIASVAYNSSTMKFFSISHTGTTVTLAYSADSISWTTIGTTTLSFAITSVFPFFATYSTVSQASTTAKWDSVNVQPSIQYSRPSADAAAGGWTPTPGTPTTLWDKLDEATVDDTDYISATAA